MYVVDLLENPARPIYHLVITCLTNGKGKLHLWYLFEMVGQCLSIRELWSGDNIGKPAALEG